MSDALVTLVDGRPMASVPASDGAVLRGDGCFEAVRSYDGRLFRFDDHIDRLEASAAALGLEVPRRRLLEEWAKDVAAGRGDCIVRIVLTRGAAVPGATGAGRCIVLSHPLGPVLDAVRLFPVEAPWHPAGREWELAGVKSISYAPNLAATRRAVEQGYDDALLVSDDSIVLEGPTFSVAWVSRGVIHTPSLILGILESITRRAVMEWVPVVEVVAGLDALLAADEVFVMSTVKEVTPVVAVGDHGWAPGPVAADLRQRVARAAVDMGDVQTSAPSHPR